jgi:hypothetical protein
MSIPEVLYRADQWRQAGAEKKEIGSHPDHVKYTVVPRILPPFEFEPEVEDNFDIYGIGTDPAEITDWSGDFSTGKRFPARYAKEINMRNDRYGSARHVWEINRMLFLPRFALLYKKSGKPYFLGVIKRVIRSWAEQNPYLIGINWYSNIEVNIRLINWFITWEILEADELAQNDSSFKDFIDKWWVPSIYQHCKFSRSHPSLHSSANNHLIAEYAGLFVASSKWHFNESDDWNIYSRLGLEREILRQHSRNGINKEEAAGYIQFIADFLLIPMIIAKRVRKPFSNAYHDQFHAILNYINEFLTANGEFPKYGDEDDGRVFLLNRESYNDNNFLSLLQSGSIFYGEPGLNRGARLPDQKNLVLFGKEASAGQDKPNEKQILKSSKFYPEEGHFIFRKQTKDGKEIYCHFDAAPLGYLSIAAHGHADALSFILYLDGDPFFVDPGTYCYHTEAQWRRYFVSTRAHNTVCISGADQATFIGPTLWHEHYKAGVDRCVITNGYEYVVARHNGYKKFNCIHTRKIEFFPNLDKISITDHVVNESGRPLNLELPFHLHPDLKCNLGGNRAVIEGRQRKVQVNLDNQLDWMIVKGRNNPCLGWYSDRFYNKTPSAVIIGSKQFDRDITLRTDLIISDR